MLITNYCAEDSSTHQTGAMSDLCVPPASSSCCQEDLMGVHRTAIQVSECAAKLLSVFQQNCTFLPTLLKIKYQYIEIDFIGGGRRGRGSTH